MVDATEGEIQNQDLKIAALAWEAGRGLILVVNKWDLAEKDDKTTAKYQKAAGEKAPFLDFVPFLFTSALTGQRVNHVLELILEVEVERAKRINTSEVNEKLHELLARRQPPQAAGREIKLNFATQVETKPPTIVVFGNAPDLVEEHYVRYLHNGFRSFWGFTGNPLRIMSAPQGRMIESVAAVVVSYLLGSIPAAYLAGRSRGIDLRKHGSGNLGATNVIRVLGTKIGLLVFAFDMAKGGVPVALFPRWVPVAAMPLHDPTIFAIVCGVAAIIGHVRPIYLKFGRGGKGVATAAGVFLALAPIQTLLTLRHLRRRDALERLRVARLAHQRRHAPGAARRHAVERPVAVVRRQRAARRRSSSGRTARTSRGCAKAKSIASASAAFRPSGRPRRSPSVW